MVIMKMWQVRRDESLSPDEKRAALDEWTRKRNEVLKMTVGKVMEGRGERRPGMPGQRGRGW